MGSYPLWYNLLYGILLPLFMLSAPVLFGVVVGGIRYRMLTGSWR